MVMLRCLAQLAFAAAALCHAVLSLPRKISKFATPSMYPLLTGVSNTVIEIQGEQGAGAAAYRQAAAAANAEAVLGVAVGR